MSTPIVDFYAGRVTDTAGRTAAEIQAWDDNQLEHVHDYIQWLFPLPERSRFNPAAPLLDSNQIAEFQRDAALRAKLLASFDTMLRFYGFQRHQLSIDRSDAWAERRANWLTPYNHNHLRMTRILRSMTILGLKDEAIAFHDALQVVGREHPEIITAATLEYWQRALDDG